MLKIKLKSDYIWIDPLEDSFFGMLKTYGDPINIYKEYWIKNSLGNKRFYNYYSCSEVYSYRINEETYNLEEIPKGSIIVKSST